MQGASKYVIVVVVVVVLVLFIGWRMKSSGMVGGPRVPDHVLQRKISKIQNKKPYKEVTLTLGEWKDLGHEKGKYKNPETDEFDMVSPMKCMSCGEQIPSPEIPEPKAGEDPLAGQDIMMDYVCPKCGKKANLEGPPM